MTTQTDFAVFANGTFWGVWVAEDAATACQMAANEFGTDGNTDGLDAIDADEVSPEDMEV